MPATLRLSNCVNTSPGRYENQSNESKQDRRRPRFRCERNRGCHARHALPAGAQAGPEAAVMAKPAAAVAGSAKPGVSAPVQMTISMATPAAPAPAESRGPNCTGNIRDERTIEVAVGKSSLIPLSEPVRNRTLGNPNVVQATMVSPQQLYVVGRSVGTTNMILQGRSGSCSVVNVMVSADAGGLQTSLAQLLPANRRSACARRLTTGADGQRVERAVRAAGTGDRSRLRRTGDDKKGGGVLNMLSVDTPQQVMLEVKVAEVSKTLLNQLGSAVNLQGGFGSWSGGLATALLSGAATTLFASKSNRLPFRAQLDAQKNDSPVKVPPNPTSSPSAAGSQLPAGGKIYIPVAQSTAGGIPTITLQEEEFGVGLKFTPTVLANGRINLRVAPEVSELAHRRYREQFRLQWADRPPADHDTARLDHRADARRRALPSADCCRTMPAAPSRRCRGRRGTSAGCSVPQQLLPAGPDRIGVHHHAAPRSSQ